MRRALGSISLGGQIGIVAALGWLCPFAFLFLGSHATTAVGIVASLGALAAMLAVIGRLTRPITAAARLLGAPGGAALLAKVSDLSAKLDRLGDRWSQRHGLTGLPTRESFLAGIAADIDRPCAPALLGVIRFADYQRLAAFDQDSAEAALRAFAGRLAQALPRGRPLAHVDRDCFAIWFQGAATPDAARAELKAVVYALGQQIADEGIDLLPTVEAGSAIFPDDAADAGTLLTRALASLGAHEAGGAAARSPVAAASRARSDFAMEQALRQAIARREFELHYQPVVDLAEGRLIGAEALLRWRHPVDGPISPGQFVPILEQSDLADKIGLWTLNTACRDARGWADRGLDVPSVAVNVSARQLHNPALAETILRTLKRHDLDPSRLELELTETAAMVDGDRTRAVFAELRAQGVKLAIDDFGSGYSSLSYVKNLPFDKLKIDREFVTDVDSRADSQAICRALIALTRGLGIRILAEGVETLAEVEALHAMGCSIFQGYYFARPMPAAEFAALTGDPEWTDRLKPAVLQRRSDLRRQLSA